MEKRSPKSVLGLSNLQISLLYLFRRPFYAFTRALLKLAKNYQKFDLKKIDFPASVTSISISSGFAVFFYEAKLECFSYAGTTDFSSLNRFFSSETNIYVSEEYPSTYFASLEIAGRGKICDVSKKPFKTNECRSVIHFCIPHVKIPFYSLL